MSFPSRTRVKSNPATRAKGLDGREGEVHGWTTPSTTGVEVIGDTAEDYAVHVFFDELDEGFWLADDLLECLDGESEA